MSLHDLLQLPGTSSIRPQATSEFADHGGWQTDIGDTAIANIANQMFGPRVREFRELQKRTRIRRDRHTNPGICQRQTQCCITLGVGVGNF